MIFLCSFYSKFIGLWYAFMIRILSIMTKNVNSTRSTIIVKGQTQLKAKHIAETANNYAYLSSIGNTSVLKNYMYGCFSFW